MVLGDLLERNASMLPEGIGIVFNDKKTSWAQLNERVDRLAAYLKNMGIKKGDKVSSLFFNCDQFVEIFFAIAKIGAISVPLNFRLVGRELEYIISNSESKLLFFGGEFKDVIASIRPNLDEVEHYIISDQDADGDYLKYEDIFKAASLTEKPNVQVNNSDPMLIIYTSGTTGLPKGATLSHNNLLWNIVNVVVALKWRQDDYSLIVPPLFHGAALACWLLPSIFMGNTSLIKQKFDPEDVLKTIASEKVTTTILVPSMWNLLLNVPGIEEYDLSSLRVCATGGSILPLEVRTKIKQLFPNGGVADLYGLVEAGPLITALTPEDDMKKPGSIGKRVVAIECKVVKNDKMEEVKVGEIGEIIAKGPTIMSGYYNNPKASASALKGGWLWTGDLARMDEDGYLYIVDRKKDMIITGGENVYPAEIEQVLYSNEKILEAAVIGRPDEKWGEKIVAFIVLKQGCELSADDLIAYCRQRIAGYKCPKQVIFIDSLPRNAAGKVLKQNLRT
jgi:acyl-CoA synthetase (AMP-forming)/AMP-acid ligase II